MRNQPMCSAYLTPPSISAIVCLIGNLSREMAHAGLRVWVRAGVRSCGEQRCATTVHSGPSVPDACCCRGAATWEASPAREATRRLPDARSLFVRVWTADDGRQADIWRRLCGVSASVRTPVSYTHLTL